MIELKIRRTDPKNVNVVMSMDGGTDELLDELAAGMASVIVKIADDLPVVDDIHESLARVTASRMIDHVRMELDLRGEARAKPTET